VRSNAILILATAVVLLCSVPNFLIAGVDDLSIQANEQASVSELQQLLRQVDQHNTALLKGVTGVKLLNVYDATALNHGAGTPTKVDGSYANQCLVGTSKSFLTSGASDNLDAGQYLVICRMQELDDVTQRLACHFEVTYLAEKPMLWSTSSLASDLPKGQWSLVALRIRPKIALAKVDYHFFPQGHSVVLDQIFVLQLSVGTNAPGVAPRTGAAVPIEVTVPSAPMDSAPSTAPSAAPADPNDIERPEFQNAPKPLVKSITSITSMMVSIADDGEAHGLTSDIIAIVPPESRRLNKSGIGFARTDGDDEMKTALDEAVRAVTLRYPIWAPGHIDISFGEKFVSHGGPSAGTAFGVLMLSVLEGFSIDPKCAVTGDITVDWKVRKVGGVSAKLHGATLDKCLYATIPQDNEVAFADMGCLYGHSALWGIQVFSIDTLQDAVAIVRKDRAPDLTQAINLFVDLQPQLTRSETTALRNPKIIETLHKILELAPNHLSAKYVLALTDGTASKTLSQNGTLHQLSVIFYPYRTILENRQGLDRTTLPAYVTTLARKRLNALRPIANRDLLPLVNDISALISTMDDFADGGTSADTVVNRAQAVDARFATLDSAPDFAERLVREGY